jgi:O-glycosyl hydrolase
MKSRSVGTACGLVAFILALSMAASAPAQNCTVDWNEVHQRIDGFGASSAFSGRTWSLATATAFFSTNSGLGLSLLRNQIQPGGFATASEISLMTNAQALGAKVWSTPWSPQASFKDNNNTVGGNFLSASNQVYASQLANYVLNLKNTYGLNIYAVSIQNEPDANVGYASCHWTSSQFSSFVTNFYQALVSKNVASTKIILPESENWTDPQGLATATMSDPNAAADVGIIANHNYVNDNLTGDTNSPAIVPTYGKALWETEVATLGGAFDPSISNAMYWAKRIHLFLTVPQVNAWHYWWLITGNSDNEGLMGHDSTGDLPSKRMYVVGQFSRFVRPGFYRMGAANTGSALITAYQETNTGNFAIVAINTNASTNIVQTFTLTNFATGSVTPWITSSNFSLGSQPSVTVSGSSFTYTLPALSVVTFVGGPPPPLLAGWGNNDFSQIQISPSLSNTVAVAAGGYHSLFLQPDGSVVALGDDSSGQCDVPPGLSNIIAVSAGGYHSLALRSDGAVFAWGDDSYGQRDIPANATNIVAISAGTWHSLALRADGSVLAWGDDSWKQTEVPAGGSNGVVVISAGGYHNLALRSDCSVIAWGSDMGGFGSYAGQSEVPPGLTQVVGVAAGGYHSLALRADGTTVAWGDNSFGQSSVPGSANNAVAIAAGDAHSLALRADGSVVTWGDNYDGQCSIATNLTGITAVAAGGDHSLTLRGQPPTGPLLSASCPARNSFAISLPTTRGKPYFLQYKSSLNASNWNLGSALVGNGAVKSWNSSLTNSPSRFFRVRQGL